MSADLVITDFRPLRQNSLRGFATVEAPSGMVLHDVPIHVSGGRPWASPPSKQMIDRGGSVMRTDQGKVRYVPVVSFTTKEIRDKWSNAVIDALRVTHPQALADEGDAR